MKKPHTLLKNIHQGKDIWVLGAGSSLNHVSKSFFDSSKIVIGVNRICKFFRCDYVVSKDPVGFDEIRESVKDSKVILSEWKFGDPPSWKHLANPHPCLEPTLNSLNGDFYYFTHPTKAGQKPLLEVIGSEDIVVSHSTITSAIHMAAYMGAKNIILCGHDCGSLDGEVNVKNYYEKICPNQGDTEGYVHFVSKQIEEHTIQVKEKIYDVYGVPIYSLNPFVNFGLEGHEYTK